MVSHEICIILLIFVTGAYVHQIWKTMLCTGTQFINNVDFIQNS